MQSWPESVERFARVLRENAVEARLEEFEDGTPTADAAARAVGCDRAQIVKSLVFVCDELPLLALVPGDRRADEAAIAAAVPAERVRVAKADEVLHATGFEPGGVAPFPQRATTQTLIDPSLLRHDVVWIGAGTHAHMASLPPADLQRLTEARAVDLVGGG